MRYNCQGCGAGFTIPDQKLAQGSVLRFSCPNCKNRIELSADELIQVIETNTDVQPNASLEPDDDFQDDAHIFEAVEEGVNTSLVWVQKSTVLEKLGEVLRQLNFHVTIAQNSREALYKIRHNLYDLVVFENDLRESQASVVSLLPPINHFPMPIRRKFMLCILSETMPSFDHMQAFMLGADLIINIRDMDKAKTILSKGIKEHRSSYRIFWEELERKGQL